MFGRRKNHLKNQTPIFHGMVDSEQQLFLQNSKEKDDQLVLPHPKIWAVLGAIYVVTGGVQVILASLWYWWLGAFFGLSLAKLGTTLIGIGMAGGTQQHLPPGSPTVAYLRNFFAGVVTWGSNKFQRMFYYLRWPVIGYGVFVILLITIHLYSKDPQIRSWPSGCDINRQLGCSRVAHSHPHASRGIKPLYIESRLNDTQEIIEEWISSQTGSTILFSTPGFVHTRFVTPVFGFADDFFVSLECDVQQSGKIIVEAQGQLRMGKSDLRVNFRRNARFFKWLAEGSKQQRFPPGQCLLSPPPPSFPSI